MSDTLYAARVAGMALSGLDHAIASAEPPAPFSTTRRAPLCGIRGGRRALFRFRDTGAAPVPFDGSQAVAIWAPCRTCLAVMRRDSATPATSSQPTDPTETGA